MQHEESHLGNRDINVSDSDFAALDGLEADGLAADEQELEGLEAALGGINQLTELGNRAAQLGLIVGHGYHGGQYEILRQGEIITLTPEAAVTFLQNLMQPNLMQPDLIQGADG